MNRIKPFSDRTQYAHPSPFIVYVLRDVRAALNRAELGAARGSPRRPCVLLVNSTRFNLGAAPAPYPALSMENTVSYLKRTL